MNKHLGAIEGKVSEITKKYEELKKSDESKDERIKKLAEARAQLETQKEKQKQELLVEQQKKEDENKAANPAG